MATYIALLSWTEQGVKNFKDSPNRADAARELFAKAGVTMQDIWWTIGSYDLVTVVDSPDDESFAAALLQLGAAGNVRTTTMRAFSQSEFQEVVSRAG